MGGEGKTRPELLEALKRWVEQTAWRWNRGLEQAADLRETIISVGEGYEESLSCEIELHTQEDGDGTGFWLTFFIDSSSAEETRDAVGPVRFDYVPGLTDEQRAEYAKAVAARKGKRG